MCYYLQPRPHHDVIVKIRFLLGTGRMPHPVGGAMGVTLCTAAIARRPLKLTSH